MSDRTEVPDDRAALNDHRPVNQDVPLSLMKMALALLDRDGKKAPACHLQQAIDCYLDKPCSRPGPELDAQVNNWLDEHPAVLP